MATGIFNCLKCLIFWFFYPKSFGSFSSQFRKAEACLKLLGKVIWKTNFRSHKIPHVLRSHTLGDHSLKKKKQFAERSRSGFVSLGNCPRHWHQKINFSFSKHQQKNRVKQIARQIVKRHQSWNCTQVSFTKQKKVIYILVWQFHQLIAKIK